MRYQIVLASALAALASAQSSSSTTTERATATTSKSPTQTCLENCEDGDVYCAAACVGVPRPDRGAMNDTTDCVAQCDQGDGSPADNNAFRQCQDACISSYITTASLAAFTGGADSSQPTGAAATDATATADDSDATGTATGSASDSDSTAASTGDSDSHEDSSASATSTDDGDSSASATGSDSSSSPTDTGNAAAMNMPLGTIGGIAGLLLAAVGAL